MALPFALIRTNANCTHNSVLTFLFDDHGNVSNVAWQIASETCAYLQFDAWGGGRGAYTQSDDNPSALIAAFRQGALAVCPRVRCRRSRPTILGSTYLRSHRPRM